MISACNGVAMNFQAKLGGDTQRDESLEIVRNPDTLKILRENVRRLAQGDQ
jgi:hypothetical protein